MSEDEVIVLAMGLLVSGAVMLVVSITLGIQKLIERRERLLDGESVEAHKTEPSVIHRPRFVFGTNVLLILLAGIATTAFGGYLFKKNVATVDQAYENQSRELIPRFMQAWRNDRLEESLNIIDKHRAVANHPGGQRLIQIVQNKMNTPEHNPAQIQSVVNGAFPYSWWKRESPQIVLVAVRVEATGKVTRARALVGSERLFPAAEAAASQFVFSPATSIPDKVPIEDTQIVAVGFGVDTSEENRPHQKTLEP